MYGLLEFVVAESIEFQVVLHYFLFHFLEDVLFQLCTTKNLLSEAKQPYNCLIDSIKVRDDENRRMKDNIDSLTDDIR